MKKVLLAMSLVLLAGSASAQHFGHHGGYGGGHYGHGGYRGGNWGWGPVLGGALAGAVIYDIYNRPVVVQQPPVVIQQQQPVMVQQNQNCTPWTETQNSDGTITRTRTCNQ
jgi:uncharacterized membrane protein